MEGLGRRQDVDLHDAREPEVVRRPAADRRGRRLHDQPGQEGGVAELHLRGGEPHRQGHRRPHARRHLVGRRSQAPHAGHVRPAQAHMGEAGRQGDHQVPRAGRGRLGAVHARASREGPVRALQGQPVLLRRQAGRRPRRAAQLRQPRRDGRRAQARGDRRRRGRPRHRLPSAGEGPEHRHRAGQPGRDGGVRDQRRRGPQEAAPCAGRPARAPGDRPRDRQEDDRQPRPCRPGNARPGAEHLAQPRVGARDPRRPAATTSISTRRTRSSTRRATRTPTATASARCPAAGAR